MAGDFDKWFSDRDYVTTIGSSNVNISTLDFWVTDEIAPETYDKTSTATSDNKSAYIEGAGTEISDSQSAYIRGGSATSDSQLAYIRGSALTVDNQAAYMKGGTSTSSNKTAYISGLYQPLPFTEPWTGSDNQEWRRSHWVTSVV